MPSRLAPFWNYYGGKYRTAPRYPKPSHGTIIEPFAGAAGYSMRYHAANVILVEKYPVICEVWRYLIGASRADIMRIPLVEHVDALPDCTPQGARWLVGFNMNTAAASPRLSLSAGNRWLTAHGRNYAGWTEARRERTAAQVGSISHWRVVEGDYTMAPDLEVTWFVDPPYQQGGEHYVHPSGRIDYTALGEWCQNLRGQIIVYESEGADWLPFVTTAPVKGLQSTKREAVWIRDQND